MQSTNYFGWGIFIFFLVVLLYLFYRWRKSLLMEESLELPSEEKKSIKKSQNNFPSKFLNFFAKSPRRQKRLKFLRWRRKHKKKEKEYQDIFLEFALTPIKLAAKPIDKLGKVVKRHSPKETAFQKLEKLHEKKLEKEKKIKEKIARKKEHKHTILKLKKIVEKK